MSRTLYYPGRLMLAALCLSSTPLFGGWRAAEADDYETTVLPLLERHCTRCHGARIKNGELDLSVYVDEAFALKDPAGWRSIHDRVVDGSMPPGARSSLLKSERRAFLGWIEASFSFDTEREATEPGRPVLRRLNHTEYRYTIRDLFGIDFPADELFPVEGAGHGFDTSGDALSMPDAMFEKYLDAAEEIAGAAIVTEETGPPPTIRRGPEAFTGDGGAREDGWSLYSPGAVGFGHDFPRDGEYLLRACAWAQQAGPELARVGLGIGVGPSEESEVSGGRGETSIHETRVRVTRGLHRVEARFVNDYYDPDHPDPEQRDRNLYIVWLEVVGPLDPPPIGEFQRELFARFGEELGAGRLEAIIEFLAQRAWRRPITTQELGQLDRLVRDEESLEARTRLALTAILTSPHFLFRPELDPPGVTEGQSTRPLNDFELATRLSYFLWSSTPDEALLEAARRGDLQDEARLLAEIDRMLAEPRARALASGFGAQWLQVRSLAGAAVDAELFPEFDGELRASMREETLLFFEALLREGRSVWELVDGEFTFVDERLAAHYGLDGVSGKEMRRVSLAGLPRRGVLTHASVLTLTSNPNRTSPVKRGKWIMETLLGTAPPPPPPGVEALDESPAAVTAASMRERLEIHRADPACAVCHVTMDPLGFGLEHYDPVGAWRVMDGAFPVDASGELPDGRRFDGALELVEVLREEEGFVRCLLEKLFVYALGRGLTEGDTATIDALLATLDPEDPTLREMIEGLVLSSAFRHRSLETLR